MDYIWFKFVGTVSGPGVCRISRLRGLIRRFSSSYR